MVSYVEFRAGEQEAGRRSERIRSTRFTSFMFVAILSAKLNCQSVVSVIYGIWKQKKELLDYELLKQLKSREEDVGLKDSWYRTLMLELGNRRREGGARGSGVRGSGASCLYP